MKPYQVKFYLYAEDDQEIQDLQCSLYDFVSTLYNEGTLLTASKLKQMIMQFSKNPFIKQYLK